MVDEPPGRLLHQDKLIAHFSAVTDERTRVLARVLLTTLWREANSRRPESDFDLELFARTAIAFCGQQELIAAILRGDHEDPWGP